MKLKKTIVLLIFVFVLLPANSTFSLGAKPRGKATCIVIDAETGRPIEGAVAIAIWRKSEIIGTFWEGASLVACRVEEAVSDQEGKIKIDDFWDWKLNKHEKPHLTIYKPKYVCWDQELIFPSYDDRTDFDKGKQQGQVYTFDKRCEMWSGR